MALTFRPSGKVKVNKSDIKLYKSMVPISMAGMETFVLKVCV